MVKPGIARKKVNAIAVSYLSINLVMVYFPLIE
jgi:hypothetical protein